LLINRRDPTSFEYLRTVNTTIHTSYHDACRALNLHEGDLHWNTTLDDAALGSSSHLIRTLFVIVLTTCFPLKPDALWEKYKESMSEKILHLLRTVNHNPDLEFTPEIYIEALVKIENLCMFISNDPLINLRITSIDQQVTFSIMICNVKDYMTLMN